MSIVDNTQRLMNLENRLGTLEILVLQQSETINHLGELNSLMLNYIIKEHHG